MWVVHADDGWRNPTEHRLRALVEISVQKYSNLTNGIKSDGTVVVTELGAGPSPAGMPVSSLQGRIHGVSRT
ncbi:hypothetical protein [Cellvibrio sp. PSBB006]|uniref:hypothetical protein n=1 Tax=Cellvibrio sp. PSBB006 TaxID=1987723 RepID=UPI0012F8DE8B|nr:hypothetical protein [Cellvibrio sp. PSBB006]